MSEATAPVALPVGDDARPVFPDGTAAAAGFACCHVCRKLAPPQLEDCPRCGAHLHVRKPESLQRTAALLATAAVLYIPANVFPIMTTTQLGVAEPSTILGGVVLLMEHGSWAVASIIFVASVLVPIGKLMSLTWLCYSVWSVHPTSHYERTVLYRVTEWVGRWSMTDVFVVAILVALIQLRGVMQIEAGPAAIAFGAVVILTMLAAEAFDPRLIWDQLYTEGDLQEEMLG